MARIYAWKNERYVNLGEDYDVNSGQPHDIAHEFGDVNYPYQALTLLQDIVKVKPQWKEFLVVWPTIVRRYKVEYTAPVIVEDKQCLT